jgi:hypothetical protein
MPIQYVHDVNAYVEEQDRYLTDVIRVSLDSDGKGGYLVTASPVVANGTTQVPYVPVEGQTQENEVNAGKNVTVPTYTVPAQLTKLVQVENPTPTGDYDKFIWQEQSVPVHPLVSQDFAGTDLQTATDYYVYILRQLEEGDVIRNYSEYVTGIRDEYSSDNSRY